MDYPARARSLALTVLLVMSAFVAPSAAGPAPSEIEGILLAPGVPPASALQELDSNKDGRVDVGDLIHGSSPTPANTPPELSVEPHDSLDALGESVFVVSWIDQDRDDDARIDLFHDDGNGALPIVTGIWEDDPRDFVVWDTSALADGRYSVFAVIDDHHRPAMRVDHPQVFTVFSAAPGSEAMPMAHWRTDDLLRREPVHGPSGPDAAQVSVAGSFRPTLPKRDSSD